MGELQESLWSLLQYNNPCNYSISDNLDSHQDRKFSFEEEFLSTIVPDNHPHQDFSYSAEYTDEATPHRCQELPDNYDNSLNQTFDNPPILQSVSMAPDTYMNRGLENNGWPLNPESTDLLSDGNSQGFRIRKSDSFVSREENGAVTLHGDEAREWSVNNNRFKI